MRRRFQPADSHLQMPIFQNLRSFLDHLDRTGELVRVRRPVSVDLEMAEIADRTM